MDRCSAKIVTSVHLLARCRLSSGRSLPPRSCGEVDVRACGPPARSPRRARTFQRDDQDLIRFVSEVACKALGRKLATKAKSAMRRVRGAGDIGRLHMRRVGKRWETCAAGSKHRDAFDVFCPAGPDIRSRGCGTAVVRSPPGRCGAMSSSNVAAVWWHLRPNASRFGRATPERIRQDACQVGCFSELTPRN